MSRQRFDSKNRAGDMVSAAALNEFRREMRRNRVKPQPGTQSYQSPGGLLLQAKAAGVGIAIVKTTSTITARSSTTPGTGSATLVTWNGTALGTGATITLRHISATSAASGKYGFAVLLFGIYWLVSVECA